MFSKFAPLPKSGSPNYLASGVKGESGSDVMVEVQLPLSSAPEIEASNSIQDGTAAPMDMRDIWAQSRNFVTTSTTTSKVLPDT